MCCVKADSAVPRNRSRQCDTADGAGRSFETSTGEIRRKAAGADVPTRCFQLESFSSVFRSFYCRSNQSQ